MPRFPTVPNITRAIGHVGAGLYNAVTPRTHEPSGAVAPQSASSYLRSTLQSINPTTPSGALNIAGILVPGPGGKGLRMEGRMSPAQQWHLAKLGNVQGGKPGNLADMAEHLKGHPLAETMFRQILNDPKLFRQISRNMFQPMIGTWSGKGPDPMNESLKDVVGLTQMMKRLGLPPPEGQFPLEHLQDVVAPNVNKSIPDANAGISDKPIPSDLYQIDSRLGLEPDSHPFWAINNEQRQQYGPYKKNLGSGLDPTQENAQWWLNNWKNLNDHEKTALAQIITNILKRSSQPPFPPGHIEGNLGDPSSN